MCNKEKIMRLGLKPTTSGKGSSALPTELASSPMLAVSLFCQYRCFGVPVRSHTTVNCTFFLQWDESFCLISGSTSLGIIFSFNFHVIFCSFIHSFPILLFCRQCFGGCYPEVGPGNPLKPHSFVVCSANVQRQPDSAVIRLTH